MFACELQVIFINISQEFRDDNGDLANGHGLELQLRDFATTTRDEPSSSANRILHPAATLFTFVDEAEHSKLGGVKRGGAMVFLAPGIEIQKRQRSPDEVLASDSKRAFQEIESRAAERQEAADSPFSGCSTGSEVD